MKLIRYTQRAIRWFALKLLPDILEEINHQQYEVQEAINMRILSLMDMVDNGVLSVAGYKRHIETIEKVSGRKLATAYRHFDKEKNP